jgi:hypothetical protein
LALPIALLTPVSLNGNPEPQVESKQFAGEMTCDFEVALAMVDSTRLAQNSCAPPAGLMRRIILALGLMNPRRDEPSFHRQVAFDGFTSPLHDEKIERDRRYGNVYTVVEYPNAYIARIEMPRRVPASSLKEVWHVPDKMPDYDYTLTLHDNVLAMRAGVPGETMRRLSYVSASFPADFLTRIRFDHPVSSFKHRLRDKVIEVVVFKTDDASRVRPAA